MIVTYEINKNEQDIVMKSKKYWAEEEALTHPKGSSSDVEPGKDSRLSWMKDWG